MQDYLLAHIDTSLIELTLAKVKYRQFSMSILFLLVLLFPAAGKLPCPQILTCMLTQYTSFVMQWSRLTARTASVTTGQVFVSAIKASSRFPLQANFIAKVQPSCYFASFVCSSTLLLLADINECKSTNQCVGDCKNTDGSYECNCDPKFTGDGRKDGTGCSGEHCFWCLWQILAQHFPRQSSLLHFLSFLLLLPFEFVA